MARLNSIRVRLDNAGLDAVLVESVLGVRVSAHDTRDVLWVAVSSKGDFFVWDGDFCIAKVDASHDEAEQITRLLYGQNGPLVVASGG
jgi:hypothetical protein